jgi:molecular chaperone Hsp33
MISRRDPEQTPGDRLLRLHAPAKRIAFTFVEATAAARELQQRHRCGPCAAKVLGEGLVAVALAGTTIETPGECVSFQLTTDGPVRGLVTEVTSAGTLRGFTYKKVLEAFDGDEDMDLAPVLGATGTLCVLRSSEEQVLYRGVTSASPPDVQHNLARHFNASIQTPAAVDIVARIAVGRLAFARGLLVEKLHDCASSDFVGVLETIHRGASRAALAEGRLPEALGELFDLDDLEELDAKPLAFACRCSREKTLRALGRLSRDELRAILAAGEPREITCHFCGEDYLISLEEIRALVERSGD